MKVLVENMNIYQKLALIRKPVEILQKDKSGYGYKYVTEAQILAKITGLMDKYGVSLVPRIIPGSTVVTPYSYSKTKVTKDGSRTYEEHVNEILVQSDMEWHWINNDNPTDREIVPWAMVGQQSDASQALGSGLSYSSRYFLLKYFNVATSDDDPDHWRSMQRETEERENRTIAASIIERVNQIIIRYLDEKPDARPDVLNVVRKHARLKGKPSENPNVIADPAVAARLLEEISERFGDAE